MLVKRLSFALINFHFQDGKASSVIILSETSRSHCRSRRHIILCESSHCFSKTLQHYCTKRDDCSRILCTITAQSNGSVDHIVMTSFYPTPLGLTVHKCDYRGKTVYFCPITTLEITPYCFHNNLISSKRTTL